MTADHRRRREVAGPVGRLRGCGLECPQVSLVACADHVDEKAGVKTGKPHLNLAEGARVDPHDLAAPPGRPLVYEQLAAVGLDDRPGDPPDLRPDALGDVPARKPAHNDGVAGPQPRGRYHGPAPGHRPRRQDEPLVARRGPEVDDVRADIGNRAGDRGPGDGMALQRAEYCFTEQRPSDELAWRGGFQQVVATVAKSRPSTHLPSARLHPTPMSRPTMRESGWTRQVLQQSLSGKSHRYIP